MIKNYTDLSKLKTFEERYEYLKLSGIVGQETFGEYRRWNQLFYTSHQWRKARDIVIARDSGCDLGVSGFDIHDVMVVHHMNPITPEDIIKNNPDILNPEYLITTSDRTHKAIHYADSSFIFIEEPIVRRPGDTTLW